MTTTMPSRAAIDAAGDLDFNATRSEKQANISLTAGPAGITVTVEWTGPLSGIPAAIERLRAAGVLELVTPPKGTAAAAPYGATPRKAGEKVSPEWNGAGEAMCPVHKRILKQGKWGMYCSAKGEDETYCNLKFAE